MNGPLKFLTARKILPLLDLLAKFKRVLTCSYSPNFCVARKLAKQIFYFCSCSQKIAVLGMLANARKDHSSPLKVPIVEVTEYEEMFLSGRYSPQRICHPSCGIFMYTFYEVFMTLIRLFCQRMKSAMYSPEQLSRLSILFM